jgi:hypothetical protein
VVLAVTAYGMAAIDAVMHDTLISAPLPFIIA